MEKRKAQIDHYLSVMNVDEKMLNRMIPHKQNNI